MAVGTRRRATKSSAAPREASPPPRRKPTRRSAKVDSRDASDGEPRTPSGSPQRPFTPVSKPKAAAARAMEDAADLVHSAPTPRTAPTPAVLAAFVVAIVLSGVLSTLVVPRFQPEYRGAGEEQLGAALANAERRLAKLEANAGKVPKHSHSDLESAIGDAQRRLKKLEDVLAERQAEHRSGKKADRYSQADYASLEANGRVIGHSDLYPRAGDPWLLPTRDGDWFLFSLPYVKGLPRVVSALARAAFPVHPRAGHWLLSSPPSGAELPGHCLPLGGSKGHVDVALRKAVTLKSVAVEHIPKISAFNITTAPKDMTLYAILGRGEEAEMRELASFVYSIQGPPVQVFPVTKGEGAVVSRVRLQVNSNHGSESYTCLYRFRAYGDPAPDQ